MAPGSRRRANHFFDAAGFGDLHFHDLRKTAATALVTSGIDVKTAQVRLGHANPQIALRVYAQASNEADRAAAKTVGDLFRPRDTRWTRDGQ